MPRDATNIPFPRGASFRNNDSMQAENGSVDRLDTKLSLENMLLEEFNYASLTAYQAMEDRARVSNLYYVLLGTLVTTLAVISQFGGATHSYTQPLLIAMLIISSIISFTFFIKIIRLRQAHRDSLICMNTIKEFYIQQFEEQIPQIKQVFRWRLDTIPAGERLGSVTFVISYLIAFMGSLALGSAALLWLEPVFVTRQSNILPLPAGIGIAIIVSGIALLLHILYYRRSLSKRKEKAALEKLELEISLAPPADEKKTNNSDN